MKHENIDFSRFGHSQSSSTQILILDFLWPFLFMNAIQIKRNQENHMLRGLDEVGQSFTTTKFEAGVLMGLDKR